MTTTARLECAAQASSAPISRLSTGSLVTAWSRLRTAGAFSAGASEPNRMCSASSIKPRPIATRPRSRVRVRAPRRNATTPRISSTGAAGEMSKDSTCATSVVPRLAPSMTASAGTSASIPLAANDVTSSPVAVLLCSTVVTVTPTPKALKRLPSAAPRKRRRSAPKARRTPLWTMCMPHSSSATPPVRSRSTMSPVVGPPPGENDVAIVKRYAAGPEFGRPDAGRSWTGGRDHAPVPRASQ